MSDGETESALVERPEWLADPTNYFSDGLLAIFEKRGWGTEKIRYLMDHPSEALKFKSDMEVSIRLLLPKVWEAMAEAALDGTTADRREFLRRFDPDYKEGAARGVMDDDDLPDRETFLRMMRIKYGAKEVAALLALADRAGEKGGGFGEEFLAGGKYEDESPEEIMEAEFEVVEKKDEEPEIDIWGDPV